MAFGKRRFPAKKSGSPSVSFIYAGKLGSGLEATLTLYEAAKREGFSCRLVLSTDNSRRALVERIYPEAKFINFLSPAEVLAEARVLSGNIAFFTMISPKMFPLFFAARAKRIFYFHASYDRAFNPPGASSIFSDKYFDILHSLAIRNSDLVVATQHPLAWQVKVRFGKEAASLLHPPFSVLRKGMFDESKKVALPFSPGGYFLDFGGLDRPYKGTDVLLKAVDGTHLPTVLAGKAKLPPHGKNVFHMCGWLSDGEMHFLVKNAKCVVLPYLSASQFSGCMALAFHFGVPVVAPFCPAFEGWIEEGKTGWFFPQGDWRGLRAKMESVASGKAKFSKSAIAGKEKEMESKSRAEIRKILARFMP
ncbi:MAG: glycosyltransferase [Candidatus Micrarchaeota archaeon]|nr:glycosyltransferase [Candidatus Micrarchaeota archaeon]